MLNFHKTFNRFFWIETQNVFVKFVKYALSLNPYVKYKNKIIINKSLINKINIKY